MTRRERLLDLTHELQITALAFAVVSVLAGTALLVLRQRGRPWLPLQRLRRGQWWGGEVAFLMLIYIVVPPLVVDLLSDADFYHAIYGEDVSALRRFNLTAPLTYMLVLALHLTLLYTISRTRPQQVGLSAARWRTNTALGALVFLFATPVVLLLNFLVIITFEREPHQLEKLSQESLWLGEWLLLVGQAAFLAPLLEEWLFRGLIQGWLRRASLLGHFVLAVFGLYLGSAPTLNAWALSLEDETVTIPWGPAVFAAILVAGYVVGVVRLWRPVIAHGLGYFAEATETGPTGHAAADTPARDRLPLPLLQGPRWERFRLDNARWAVVGSALLFAVSHQTWPSQVPLFVLGLLLGWLKFRTQNLLACIVLHGLFNLVASLVLLYGAYMVNGNGDTTALRPDSTGVIASSTPDSW